MRVAADARHADSLPRSCSSLVISGLARMLWVMMFLMLPMNTTSVAPLDVSVDDADAPEQTDLDIAAENRRRRR